jgi:peptide deformylase
MSVREIVTIGDPRLREHAREVDREELASAAVQELIDDLIETKRAADGAGIAAPQVGEPLRIAIAEVAGTNPRYPYKPPIPLTVAINPVVEPLDDELVEINEGCLSVPWRGVVARHVNVRVRYADREGAAHDAVVRGLTAGTWQHECDHLDGIVFADRADPSSFTTWENYERFHRASFVERITEFVERVGS